MMEEMRLLKGKVEVDLLKMALNDSLILVLKGCLEMLKGRFLEVKGIPMIACWIGFLYPCIWI